VVSALLNEGIADLSESPIIAPLTLLECTFLW
jgi:hypothetical protein